MLGISALALGAILSVAPALKFDALQFDGKWVLMLRDCGEGDRKNRRTECEEWETQVSGTGDSVTASGQAFFTRRRGGREFYPGDAEQARRALANGQFEEVWLLTGGGDSNEGMALGRVLRSRRITVRVPGYERLRRAQGGVAIEHAGMCVSACTVAFMGGLFRYIDSGADFKVHSRSAYMGLPRPSLVRRMVQGEFRALAADEQRKACAMVLERIRYFQNALLLLRGTQLPDGGDFLASNVGRCRPGVVYTDSLAIADQQRFAVEGIAAVQDIMMRMERLAIRAAVESWRSQLESFGPRAGPALRMVEAMNDTSIMEAAGLTEETLLRMGYVTQDVAIPNSKP